MSIKKILMQKKYFNRDDFDLDDIYSLAEKLGIDEDKILDFSSTINPFGIPKSVVNAIKDNIPFIQNYPDSEARYFIKEAARVYDILPSWFVCGNGSSELIHLIIQLLQPERLLLLAPTSKEYEKAFNIHVRLNNTKASLEYVHLKEDNHFAIDTKQVISAITGGKDIDTLRKSPVINTPDMVILNNPNNPTGSLISRDELLEIARITKMLKIYLVVDEAFIDFCPEHTLIRDVIDNPYLIVIRSFSCFYSLAGLRLGFSVMSPSMVEKMKRFRQTWSVNILAQVCGSAVINDKDFINQTITQINEEKTTLEDGFKAVKIKYFPSACNFYLIMINNAQEVSESLRKKAILVRECADFRGLNDKFIRITVRSYRDNMRLLKELARLLI